MNTNKNDSYFFVHALFFPLLEQLMDKRSINNSASGWRTGKYLILKNISPITMMMDPTIRKIWYIFTITVKIKLNILNFNGLKFLLFSMNLIHVYFKIKNLSGLPVFIRLMRITASTAQDAVPHNRLWKIPFFLYLWRARQSLKWV